MRISTSRLRQVIREAVVREAADPSVTHMIAQILTAVEDASGETRQRMIQAVQSESDFGNLLNSMNLRAALATLDSSTLEQLNTDILNMIDYFEEPAVRDYSSGDPHGQHDEAAEDRRRDVRSHFEESAVAGLGDVGELEPSDEPVRCEDCGVILQPSDKAAYRANGGSGWPAVCEDCAEMAAVHESDDRDICTKCNGNGIMPSSRPDEKRKCPACNGTGEKRPQ